MRGKFLISLTIVVVVLWPASVFAHTAKTDNNISAVMHIEPDDHPLVGQESKVFFTFKAGQSEFDERDCDCTASVLRNGNVIFSKVAYANEQSPLAMGTESILTFVFPEAGMYQVEVKGAPKSGANFSAFTLRYDVEAKQIPVVAGGTHDNHNSFGKHTLHIIIFGSGLLFLTGYLVYDIHKKRRSKAATIGTHGSTDGH